MAASATTRWIDHAAAARFVSAVRAILNGHVYLVPVTPVRPLASADAIAILREAIASAALEAPLQDAVLAEDRALVGHLTCRYAPPHDARSIGVSLLDDRAARRRLEAMLLPARPYLAPYRRATPADEARSLTAAFLASFAPPPTVFAEVDPGFLAGWTWSETAYPEARPFVDGFCDSVLALGAGAHLALLINNGSD